MGTILHFWREMEITCQVTKKKSFEAKQPFKLKIKNHKNYSKKTIKTNVDVMGREESQCLIFRSWVFVLIIAKKDLKSPKEI